MHGQPVAVDADLQVGVDAERRAHDPGRVLHQFGPAHAGVQQQSGAGFPTAHAYVVVARDGEDDLAGVVDEVVVARDGTGLQGHGVEAGGVAHAHLVRDGPHRAEGSGERVVDGAGGEGFEQGSRGCAGHGGHLRVVSPVGAPDRRRPRARVSSARWSRESVV